MRNQSKSKPLDCSPALAIDLTRMGHALLSLGLGRFGLSHVSTQKISLVDSSSRKKRICESGGQKKRKKKNVFSSFSSRHHADDDATGRNHVGTGEAVEQHVVPCACGGEAATSE
jgi:hypothetical protein